ncbi:hypothetical protein FVE85_8856 [Porphyridium purpureum]|uniref:Uncharacterized protein n=1 Tax=Porphyridium purpureum TaxID=35688 RepID=A0A5J4YPG0_PORPP|nr:hypothetical protein FVE85_8856 [Porphyridium purpureum]|eukprot:POR2126..scf296_7
MGDVQRGWRDSSVPLRGRGGTGIALMSPTPVKAKPARVEAKGARPECRAVTSPERTPSVLRALSSNDLHARADKMAVLQTPGMFSGTNDTDFFWLKTPNTVPKTPTTTARDSAAKPQQQVRDPASVRTSSAGPPFAVFHDQSAALSERKRFEHVRPMVHHVSALQSNDTRNAASPSSESFGSGSASGSASNSSWTRRFAGATPQRSTFDIKALDTAAMDSPPTPWNMQHAEALFRPLEDDELEADTDANASAAAQSPCQMMEIVTPTPRFETSALSFAVSSPPGPVPMEMSVVKRDQDQTRGRTFSPAQNERLRQLEKENQAVKQDLERLKHERVEAERLFEKLEADRERALRAKENDLQTSANLMSIYFEDNNHLATARDCAVRDLQAAQARLEHAHTLLEQRRSELAAATEKQQHLQTELDAIRRELGAVREASRTAQARNESDIARLMLLLEDKDADIEKHCAIAEEVKDKFVESNRACIELENRCSELNDQLSAALKRAEDIEAEKERMRAASGSSVASVGLSGTRLIELQNGRTLIVPPQSELFESEEQWQSFVDLQGMFASMQAFGDVEKDTAEAAKALHEQLERKQAQVERAEEASRELRTQLEAKDEQISGVMVDLHQREIEVGLLQDELSRNGMYVQEIETHHSEMQQSFDELQQEHFAQQGYMKRLEAELAESAKQVSDLHAENQALTQQVQEWQDKVGHLQTTASTAEQDAQRARELDDSRRLAQAFEDQLAQKELEVGSLEEEKNRVEAELQKHRDVLVATQQRLDAAERELGAVREHAASSSNAESELRVARDEVKKERQERIRLRKHLDQLAEQAKLERQRRDAELAAFKRTHGAKLALLPALCEALLHNRAQLDGLPELLPLLDQLEHLV